MPENRGTVRETPGEAAARRMSSGSSSIPSRSPVSVRVTPAVHTSELSVRGLRRWTAAIVLAAVVGFGIPAWIDYQSSSASEAVLVPIATYSDEAGLVCSAEFNKDIPWGNPFKDPNSPDSVQTELTQGFAVGSHAPSEIWGAYDLAPSGRADGRYVIYATLAGTADLTTEAEAPRYGNSIVVSGVNYDTYDGHVAEFLVDEGEHVEPGDELAIAGSTGTESTGVHAHHEVRDKKRLNSGKTYLRVNPGDYGALNGIIRTVKNFCRPAEKPNDVTPNFFNKVGTILTSLFPTPAPKVEDKPKPGVFTPAQ